MSDIYQRRAYSEGNNFPDGGVINTVEVLMKSTKVKAIDLVFDWNLWPRQSAQKLDGTNLARMKEALKSGFTLPPVLVNSKDMRIVDGFHRTRAMLDVFGDDVEIDAILKDYDSDAEMFLEAGATNHNHGLPMSPKDRAHFISRCRRFKITWPAIAQALNMNAGKVKEFVKKRTAKTTTGETIPLPASAAKLYGGKDLNEQEEHYVRTESGYGGPSMHVSILINAIRAGSVVMNAKNVERLIELRQLIDDLLVEVA